MQPGGSPPPNLSSLGVPPFPTGQWQSWNPANANSFVQDTIWGGNLTSNLSSFPGIIQPTASEVGYMRFASGSRGSASGFGNAGRSNVNNGAISGFPFAKLKIYTARVIAIKDAPSAVVYGMFMGVAKGIGASGLFGGLGTLNTAQTEQGWRDAFPQCGFYWLPNGGSTWLIIAGDGSGAGSGQLIDTGVTVNQSNTQLLQFINKGATVDFYIAGVKVGSISAHLPNVPMNCDMGYCVFSAGNLSATGCIWGFANSSAGVL